MLTFLFMPLNFHETPKKEGVTQDSAHFHCQTIRLCYKSLTCFPFNSRFQSFKFFLSIRSVHARVLFSSSACCFNQWLPMFASAKFVLSLFQHSFGIFLWILLYLLRYIFSTFRRDLKFDLMKNICCFVRLLKHTERVIFSNIFFLLIYTRWKYSHMVQFYHKFWIESFALFNCRKKY